MPDRPQDSPMTAIVTGSSRGIGRAIAEALGALGHNVVVTYNSNADAAEQVAAVIRDAGGEALCVQCDVGKLDDHARLVDQTVERFGPIHLLVNNAGVAPKVRADLLEMPEASYDFVMDTNLKGPFLLTQRVANHMIESGSGDQGSAIGGKPGSGDQGSGIGNKASDFKPDPRTPNPEPQRSIVNVGSISAYTASVNRGEYCLAKAGIGMMTQLFAVRLAEYGINVYEIRPGVIATDMTGPVKAKYDKLILEDERGITPIRRWGQPDDIARAVVAITLGYLPFSTGEVINVDGGFHLKTL